MQNENTGKFKLVCTNDFSDVPANMIKCLSETI